MLYSFTTSGIKGKEILPNSKDVLSILIHVYYSTENLEIEEIKHIFRFIGFSAYVTVLDSSPFSSILMGFTAKAKGKAMLLMSFLF